VLDAYVGEPDDWAHDVTIAAPDANGDDFVHTPDAGVVVIGWVDKDGNERYWNGTAFVLGPPIELATTIDGTVSRYPYRHRAETRGNVVFMYGWTSRNGKRAPRTETIYRRVSVRNIGQMVQ